MENKLFKTSIVIIFLITLTATTCPVTGMGQEDFMAKKNDRSVVLVIDTSGRAGSIALGIDDNIMAEKPLDGDMRHNAELFTAIKALLEHVNKLPSDIGYIYVSIGPGSFTGLRIAVTMAKMLAITNNAKIAFIYL